MPGDQLQVRRPAVTHNKQMKQLQLTLNGYEDNNNYFRINKAYSTYNRLKIWEDENDYTFYDVIQNPPFYAIPFSETYHQSTDNMKTFKDEENVHLAGTFFFLADTIQTHTYDPYNYIQLFSDFGGLVDIVVMVFAIIPMIYSDRTVL